MLFGLSVIVTKVTLTGLGATFFYHKHHPKDMGRAESEAFLGYLLSSVSPHF